MWEIFKNRKSHKEWIITQVNHVSIWCGEKYHKKHFQNITKFMCSMDNHRIKIKIKFGYTIFILKMKNPLTLKIDNCSGDASGM